MRRTLPHFFPSAANLSSRTVHVKIHPTARTFAERREVLRVLERFGEVTMFRSLKYHPTNPVPNAFLSIFASATSVQEIINASPIRYSLSTEPVDSLSSTSKPSPLTPSQEALTPPTSQDSSSTNNTKEATQIFSLSLTSSLIPHTSYLNSPQTNPLRGSYIPVDPTRSAIAAHLSKSIDGVGSDGMCDWESDGPGGRRLIGGADEDMGEDGAGERGRVVGGNVPWRLVAKEAGKREKRREREGRGVMGGLMGLVREREKEGKGGNDAGKVTEGE